LNEMKIIKMLVIAAITIIAAIALMIWGLFELLGAWAWLIIILIIIIGIIAAIFLGPEIAAAAAMGAEGIASAGEIEGIAKTINATGGGNKSSSEVGGTSVSSRIAKAGKSVLGGGKKITEAGVKFATSYNTVGILIVLTLGILTWVYLDKFVETKTWVSILTSFSIILFFALLFKSARKPALETFGLFILIFGVPLIFYSTYYFFSDFNPIFMLFIMAFWFLLAFIIGTALFDPEHKNKAGVYFFLFNLIVYSVIMIPITSSFMFAMLEDDSPLKYAVENQQKELGNVWNKIIFGTKRAQMEAKRQVRIVKGDYEAGVEAQSEKPLGIFLENTGTNSPVRQGEDLKIFGYIKAVTPNPQDVFKINAQCYPLSFKESKNNAAFYPPGDELSSNDYKSIDCKISTAGAKGTLGSGNQQVVLETTFDFKTSSLVKTYFMEQDVIRSYRMQNLDPLDEYQIRDKNPVAIYTGGPLMVGMRAGLLQPIPLVKESTTGPSLDITLDRTAQWPEGELMKINKLTVYLPPGLKLVDTSATCHYEAGSQVCDLKPEKYIESEIDKPIIMPNKKLRFETKIDSVDKLLGGAPLAVNSFRVDVEYTFRIKKTFDVRVTQISTGASV